MVRNVILGVFVCSYLVGCEVGSNDYPDPSLTPDDVLVAATDYLEDRETQLEDYDITLVGFDYVDRDWSVGFDGNRGIVGDHLWVTVSDDDIRDISVQPGL